MEVINKKHNQILSRTHVEVDLPFPAATPSMADVKKTVAHLTKSSEDVIVVKKIATKFGEKKALVTAYVYDSKEAMDMVEPKPKKKKEAAAK